MRPTTATAAAVLLVALAADAHAEPSRSPKDPTTATLVSVGATLVPIALGIASKNGTSGLILATAGVVLGPSAGHWYAGEVGWTGLAIRGLGLAATALVIDDSFQCAIGDGGESGKNCSLADGVLFGGVSLLIGGVIFDWLRVGDSARRANARSVQIAPTVISGPQSTGTGLGLSGAF
jgi:hypothetical protein